MKKGNGVIIAIVVVAGLALGFLTVMAINQDNPSEVEFDESADIPPDNELIGGPGASHGRAGEALPSNLTIDEYLAFIEVINHEIDMQGGELVLAEVTSGNIVDKLKESVLKRKETKPVNIKGNDYTAGEYEKLKKDLFEKFNK